MTSKAVDLSVSGIHLVVLARHSASKSPGPSELDEAVQKLALPANTPATQLRAKTSEAAESLRQRGLLTPKRTALRLTEAGNRALRTTFALPHTPSWVEIRSKHLPSLGLKLRAGSDEALQVLGEDGQLFAEVLRNHFKLTRAASFTAVCNALLLEELELPATAEPITLAWLRTQVLARRTGVDLKKLAAKLKPQELAQQLAAKLLDAPKGDKKSLVAALGRKWIMDQAGHNLGDGQASATTTAGREAPPPLALTSPTDDTLLKVVRETLPRVGSDGRYGAEKVFVSAIWRGIERDQRVAGFSLEQFKRWLLSANRSSKLVLARADLVAAMDRKQVAESLIEDQGSTFHFVLDQRPNAGSDRRPHAR